MTRDFFDGKFSHFKELRIDAVKCERLKLAAFFNDGRAAAVTSAVRGLP